MCVRDMRWRMFLKTNPKENLYVTVLCDFNLTTYFLVSPVSLSNLMIIKVILFQKLFCHRCSAHLSNPIAGVIAEAAVCEVEVLDLVLFALLINAVRHRGVQNIEIDLQLVSPFRFLAPHSSVTSFNYKWAMGEDEGEELSAYFSFAQTPKMVCT